jgi:hypothetical protein
VGNEHDDERTDPELGGDERTNPGVGADASFARAVGDLDRVVRSVAAFSRALPQVHEAGRGRFFWELALVAGEGLDVWIEFRAACLKQHQYEINKGRQK